MAAIEGRALDAGQVDRSEPELLAETEVRRVMPAAAGRAHLRAGVGLLRRPVARRKLFRLGGFAVANLGGVALASAPG